MKERIVIACFWVFIAGLLLIFNGGCSSGTQENVPSVDTVVIENMEFSPAELKIKAGDTVVWINQGIVNHDVTESSKEWTSGDIELGSSWRTVPKASFDYYCSIHPTMTGAVIVENKAKK